MELAVSNQDPESRAWTGILSLSRPVHPCERCEGQRNVFVLLPKPGSHCGPSSPAPLVERRVTRMRGLGAE